jgi:hypothetical protein
MILSKNIRRFIRNDLTLNWAGGHFYSLYNNILIKKTIYPMSMIFYSDGRKSEFNDAAPDEYTIIHGKSKNPKSDYIKGKKIKFYGRIKGTTLPKRMLGQEST